MKVSVPLVSFQETEVLQSVFRHPEMFVFAVESNEVFPLQVKQVKQWWH